MATIHSPIITPEIEQFEHHNSNFLSLAMTALRLNNLTIAPKIKSPAKQPVTTLPEITMDEVSDHCTPNDCWIIIYDRVYDVTTFLKMHPGGDDVILEYAGRDASLAFRGTGHTESAVESLKLYEIGELPMRERIFRRENGIKF